MPRSSGSGLEQRGYRLLQLLAGQFDVTVFVVSGDPVDAPGSAAARVAAMIEVAPVGNRSGLGRLVARWLPPLVALRPDWAADWPEIEAGYVLPDIRGPIELCVAFRLRMHGAAQVIAQALKPERMVLDLDDLESATLMSIGRCATRRMRLRLAFNCFSKAVQSFCLERLIVGRYDRVFLANPSDVQALRSVGGKAAIVCLPNRVVLAPHGSPAIPHVKSPMRRLLFVGTLGYFPNEDAALWIAERIVPALRRRTSLPFRVRIVGRHASPRLRKILSSVAEVEFLGEVPLLDSVYAETDVALLAVRCGGGTKVKALEAIAKRVPIVATSHAMHGLGMDAGKDYLLADTVEAIADGCAELLHQPERAAAMARSAYDRLTRLLASEAAVGVSESFPF
jgi:glycosyltransferase involved in cell wall biosynthesis